MEIYSSISANKTKTWLIMILFVVFSTTIIYLFGKALGYSPVFLIGFALIFAGITSLGSYFYSDKLVLASTGAKLIKKNDNPVLYRIVENLAIGNGTPPPRIYIMNEPSPNAFATGRDPKHAVICVTTGLLAKLNKVELEGVIAHELSHIKNYDTRLMAIVAILVGFIAIFADFFMRTLWLRSFSGRSSRGSGNIQLIFLGIGIALAILSPIIAVLIQLALSRKRELLADASASLLTRYPEGLASALEKISSDKNSIKSVNNATAQLFIVNPFKGKSGKAFLSSLFNTHPPVEERLKILRSM
ncbi:MAG: M48 family metallopeptidase [Candidatus Levyibacteriota bacterium]